MVNEYKKIVLLKGLEAMSDYHFQLIKSLMAHDLKLTRKTQEEYDRVKIADLMEVEFRGDAGLGKLIELCKDIPSLGELSETLKKERSKVKGKTPAKKKKPEDAGCATPTSTTSGEAKTPTVQKRKNVNEEKIGTKKSKVSKGQPQPPVPATARRQSPPPQISSSVQAKTPLAERTARNAVLHKDPMVAMVLKTTDPFEYESSEKGINRMFHATVATESQFFHVKVFNINLKEMFADKKFIIISNYIGCKGILEINEESVVSEAGPGQTIQIPISVIKRASETPKIDQLLKTASGTLVYGLFVLHKKRVCPKNTIYEIQDNTGKMEVVGNGKWHNITCKEGDKLRLFCFQIRTIDRQLKLVCGNHSLMKVTKTGRKKKETADSNCNMEVDVNYYVPDKCSTFNVGTIKVDNYM